MVVTYRRPTARIEVSGGIPLDEVFRDLITTIGLRVSPKDLYGSL
jgi:hypothetical protein